MADILAVLHDSDAQLDLTEPFFTDNDVPEGEAALWAAAIIALYWVDPEAPVTYARVRDFLLVKLS